MTEFMFLDCWPPVLMVFLVRTSVEPLSEYYFLGIEAPSAVLIIPPVPY